MRKLCAVSPAPVIVKAIYDVIGVNFSLLSITPEKILRAFEEEVKTDKGR